MSARTHSRLRRRRGEGIARAGGLCARARRRLRGRRRRAFRGARLRARALACACTQRLATFGGWGAGAPRSAAGAHHAQWAARRAPQHTCTAHALKHIFSYAFAEKHIFSYAFAEKRTRASAASSRAPGRMRRVH